MYMAGPGQTPDLVFSTHMDTVPPYIPFQRRRGVHLRPRGVGRQGHYCRAGGGGRGPARRQGFGLGCCLCPAKSAIPPARRWRTESPKGSRFLINGEPTDNRLALASKGALRAVFKATGKMAHSAYPELGDSAVHKLVEVLGQLLELDLPVTEDVGPSTLNIGQIHGGHAPNVIADKAEAQVLVRLVGDSAPVRAALDASCSGTGGSGFHAGDSVCPTARGGGIADDDREVHDGHSAAVQLGRAAAAGARFDSRGAHAV